MSLNNGNKNKKDLKARFKEVWEVKEFKYGILIMLGLAVILVLQLTGIL